MSRPRAFAGPLERPTRALLTWLVAHSPTFREFVADLEPKGPELLRLRDSTGRGDPDQARRRTVDMLVLVRELRILVRELELEATRHGWPDLQAALSERPEGT